MQTNLSLSCSRCAGVTVLMAALLPPTALALGAGNLPKGSQDISYFDGKDLDYWGEGKKVLPFVPSLKTPGPEASSSAPPSGSIIRQRDAEPFDWKHYENPSSPEFWDDGGDYIAPRPLREAVANPTPENLQKYAAWQARRLAVVAEFNQKLVAHTLGVDARTGAELDRGSRQHKKTNHGDLREVSLLYFYQSSCPHCQAERERVEALRRRGVQVTFVQLDSAENSPLHEPSVPYSPELSRQFAITATPTWVFRRRENVVRLQGEQSDEDLMIEIASLFQSSNSGTVGAKNNLGVAK